MSRFTFIDLFSGIGGFHQAMSSLGGKCVFASEINPSCAEVYRNNYGMDSLRDIRETDASDIPEHDVLCAGFPCQAFSKAGRQNGLADTRGTLFFEIERVLRVHKTPFILLENVRNLITHDSGNTWKTICSALKNAGYRLPEKPLLLSPHQFGIPQFRERVLIPGIYDPGNVGKPLRFVFPGLMKKEENSIYSVAGHPGEAPGRKISEKEKRILEIWDGFYRGLDIKTIGFPVWSEYFTTESPPEGIPAWKTDIIRKNRALYLRNRGFIDKWLAKHDFLRSFNPSYRKFEWQCGERIGSVFEGVIQFRPSGVRVKTPDVFPALVAMVQVPVLGRSGRRISVREAARLQSFPEDFLPHPVESEAFRQLGNSVSVKVIRAAAEELFRNSSGFKEREEDRSETGREELAHVRRR